MNSGINPKENDYELAKANAVAMNCHCLGGIFCGVFKG